MLSYFNANRNEFFISQLTDTKVIQFDQMPKKF